MPGGDKGNIDKAQQFLADLEHSYPDSTRLSNKERLSAIRRARRESPLEMVRAVLEVRKELYGFSGDTDLVNAVADLIPDEDRGNTEKARQFLIDLERRYPKSKRLSNRQLLSAVRKARQEDSLEMDRVVTEVRKKVYGYRGHPDDGWEVSVPMGGKSSR